MSWTQVADAAGLAALLAGALLCLAGAIGLLRFRDLLSRMHASTKPQVLGVLLVELGLGLRLRSPLHGTCGDPFAARWLAPLIAAPVEDRGRTG